MDPYNTKNVNGPYGEQRARSMVDEVIDHVLGRFPKNDPNIIDTGIRCSLCGRTNIILAKDYGYHCYGEVAKFAYGCAYAMRGGLCTKWKEVSKDEFEKILLELKEKRTAP